MFNEFGFYLFGATLSILCWIAALIRVRTLFSGSTGLFIGKILMIVTLITVDLLIILGYLRWLDREQFRLSMGFLTGVQIVAALTVATGHQDKHEK